MGSESSNSYFEQLLAQIKRLREQLTSSTDTTVLESSVSGIHRDVFSAFSMTAADLPEGSIDTQAWKAAPEEYRQQLAEIAAAIQYYQTSGSHTQSDTAKLSACVARLDELFDKLGIDRPVETDARQEASTTSRPNAGSSSSGSGQTSADRPQSNK